MNTYKNKYTEELQRLKSWDEVQFMTTDREYNFIETCGHGYLVIPVEDKNYKKALSLCQYGFKGDIACYLEEDCEAPAFMKLINS